MNNFIAGVATIAIDGKSYLLVGEFTYRVSQNATETLKGMDGIHGVKGSPEAGQIKAKLRDDGSVSVSDLANATDVTVTAQLANGKTVIGRNMWRAGDAVEVDADDATLPMTWEGADVRDN